jgi:hypothetical protein
MDIIRLNPFLGVAANGKATLVTDQIRGYSLHALVLKQGGTTFTKAQMTKIKIRAGEKNLLDDIAGDKLQDLNDHDGFSDTANFVMHYFGDPLSRTIRGQHLGDFDFSIYNSPLEIQVDIGAATAPTLEALAIVGAPKRAMGIGLNDIEAATVRALIPSVIQEAAAVTRKSEPIGLGSGAGARIRKIAIFHTNLTRAEFKKQGIIKHEDLLDAENDAIQLDFGKVPQAGLYVVDRVMDGNQGEAEDTVRGDGTPWNMQLLVTTSAADTMKTFADVHTLPALL